MLNATEFYPTPPSVISKMLADLKFNEITTVLEPSAGKGDIADAVQDKFKNYEGNWRSKRTADIDTIELDDNLRHILKGKGYKVIHDDFLTLETFKSYDLLIMNPPFSNGDKHLLKALDMQKSGGKVVCLLNAETIKNPYSNTRKDLCRKLDEYEVEVEFMGGAFADAERKTDVEIALIKVDIPKSDRKSIILEGLRKEEVHKVKEDKSSQITSADFLKQIVERYNFEVKAGLKLINEYYAMMPFIMTSNKGGSSSIIDLSIEGETSYTSTENAFIEKVRYKYWETLFQSNVFVNLFTSDLQKQYMEKIKELQGYDFSLYNIYSIRADISKLMMRSVEKTILDLFEEFSNKHSWYDEMSKNIHYYDGWKTNKAWVINKKVIIVLHGFGSWDGRYEPNDYRVKQKLTDVEKVFNYLDGGLTEDVNIDGVLSKARVDLQTKKIQLKYFTVTFFKKGTCHIEFTNLDLLKKFNLFGSQRKGWLPPSYGRSSYKDMSAEEKVVVDQFEGEKEYERVMEQRDYFIYNSDGLLMLSDKEA
jgi:hypothetical protein